MRIGFRVDASETIGNGHMMRCLTLAEVLQHHGVAITFICHTLLPAIAQCIEQKGIRLILLAAHRSLEAETQQMIGILTSHPLDWLIIDHYQLDATYENPMRQYVRSMMVIDDLANRPHTCDVLLDQTPSRCHRDYAPWIPVSCEQWLGAEYALIRDEFLPHDTDTQDEYTVSHILITLGGANPNNIYSLVLDSIMSDRLFDRFQLTLITPASMVAPCRQKASTAPHIHVQALTEQLGREMRGHDLVITHCGVTLLERCAMGKPGIGILVADNQRGNADAVERAGAGLIIRSLSRLTTTLIHAIDELSRHPQRCLAMMHQGRKLIDGQGKQRVAQRILAW